MAEGGYKILFFLIAILLIFGMIFLLAKKSVFNRQKPASEKLQVITTLFPLYDFAKNIGGAKTAVTLLLPPGVEPHAFEPRPNDIIAINQADIFIYTGPFMEVWVEDLLKGVTNKNLSVVDASKNIQLLPSNDPHLWLDFDNAQVMVDNIARGLTEKDPAGWQFYLANADVCKKKLQALEQKYRLSLTVCKKREIVYGGHYAFGYLAKRYKLNYVAAAGLAPDAEPTANDLAALIEQIRKNNLQYIFYEELTSPKIAETLAQETGAKMLLLNAAHNAAKKDLESGISFLLIMEENLANLKKGLECQ